MNSREKLLFRRAFALSLFTIIYNIAEGSISVFLGYTDETLSLFGFGADSFIEVLSGAGVAIMIARIRRNPGSCRSSYETAALRVTGTAFYLLSAGLSAGIILNLITNHRPVTTLWGVVISLISIGVMLWLVVAKKNVGRKLNSAPLIADANCSRVCIYMSVVLLLSSLVYELTGFQYADIIGSAGLIWFSVSEGREAFEKSKGRECSCASSCPAD